MPTVRQRTLCAGILLAAIASVSGAAGCGGSGSSDLPRAKPAKPTPAAAADLRRPGSASSTVRRYWAYLQDGALPGALDLYDGAVNQAIGVSNFSGALASQRENVARTKLNVVNVERARKGALVSVERIPRAGPKQRESFYLRRGPEGRWRLRYDTLAAGAIQAYVRQQTQYRIDPATTPSPRAIKAGDFVLTRFRAVGLR